MGFSWRTDDTFAILQLMKDRHECLWNTRSKFYRNKSKRDAAKLSIIRQLKRPGLTVKDLDGKLKSIRSRYSTELNKVKDAEKRARISGDVEDLFIPRLSWYQLANSFLRDVTLSKKVVQDGGEDCTMVDCQLEDLTNATFEDYYQQHYNQINNNSNTEATDNEDQQRLHDDSIEDELEEEEGKYEINLDPESFKCEPMAETIVESRPLRNRLRSSAVSVVNGQPQQPKHQLHQQTTNHDNHYYQNNGNSTMISSGSITNNNQHHLHPQPHHHLPHHYPRHSNRSSSLGPDNDKDPLFEQSHYYPFARMVASYLDQLPLERALISSCRIMNLLTEERLKHCREQQQQNSSNTGNNQTEPNNHHQEIINEPIIQSTKMSSLSDQIQPNGLVYPSSSSSSSATIPEIAMPDF